MKKEEIQKSQDNSFGTASVVLGIIGLTISSLPGAILGFIGLIFGMKQKNMMKNSWSKAGIILNIISIIIGIALFIYALISILENPDFLAQIQSQIQNVQ